MLDRKVEQAIPFTVQADVESVLDFLQNQPEQYLRLAGLTTEEQLQRTEQAGSWRVSELAEGPIRFRTRYTIQWVRLEKGCEWTASAPLGVRVTNTFTVQAVQSAAPSTVTERALLSCSALLLPLVKPAFQRAHKRIHAAIQRHLLIDDRLLC